MKTKMLYLLAVLLVIIPALAVLDIDIAYAIRPTKTPKPPKPTRTPKPSRTPNPNKPTPPPTMTPVPTDTPTDTPMPQPTETPEPQARPLFNMQLFVNNNPPEDWLPYCIIKADGGVSVELQQFYCGWVATNHPCGAPVMSDDTWACDGYGYYRQPLAELRGE